MNVGAIGGYTPSIYINPSANSSPVSGTQMDGTQAVGGKKVDKTDPGYQCQTCENRKYQDGSNEQDVSFKSASKIAPEAAASAVRNHEQQHVSNAYQKAEKGNGQVISATVQIHTSICPECGRSYVAGGTTRTQIKYTNEENPYQKDLKNTQGIALRGMNVDEKA